MRITDTSDLWWKDAVIYCLDVETFLDWNGDGAGDLPGLIQRIDYLNELGVTCLWLMPFYPSPDRHDGYDITDFYGVDSRLGNHGDFIEFVRTARTTAQGPAGPLVVRPDRRFLVRKDDVGFAATACCSPCPGHRCSSTGKKIGMGENLDAEGRFAVRTPAVDCWAQRRVLLRAARTLTRPVVEGGFSPEHINVAAQRRDPDSRSIHRPADPSLPRMSGARVGDV